MLLAVPVLAWLIARRHWLGTGLLGGFVWAVLHAQWVLNPQLSKQLEGVDQIVVVTIADIPRDEGRRLRFVAETDPASGLPQRLLLSWYAPFPELKPGERWRLKIRLKRPRSFSSPGAFDYAGWLFRQGVGASGYVRRADDNQRLTAAPMSVDKWRLAISQQIDAFGSKLDQPGLIKALAVGLRRGIDQTVWDALLATGTNHLLAISGLHIGMVAAIGGLAAAGFWRLFPNLGLWLPRQRAVAFLALLPATLYSALAGFSVPTQRALIMLGVASVALLLWRQIRPWQVLATALFVVLVFDPRVVMAPGFWLSFTAVAAIIALVQHQRHSGWRLLLLIQFVLLLALLPLTAGFFGRASLISPLANLIAVPLVSLIIVPLILLGIIPGNPLSDVLLIVADRFLELLTQLIRWLATFEYSAATITPPGPVSIVLAMLAVMLLLAPRGFPGRLLAPLLFLPALFIQVEQPLGDNEFNVSVLDVGQGLSVVVRTQRHTLVFDTGARFSQRASAANSVVLPFLRHIGVHSLDALVISHEDNDHAGGATLLLQRLAVSKVYRSSLNDDGNHQGEPCLSGKHWVWDGVHFEFLHPGSASALDENNYSCVLKISNAYYSALLTGDIEAAAERELVSHRADKLASTLLVVPHHGSLTSSTQLFVESVAPRWAVFSVGYRNRWGFPKAVVVERYTEIGSKVLRTDQSGTITAHFGQASLSLEQWRHQYSRWWQPSESESQTGVE